MPTFVRSCPETTFWSQQEIVGAPEPPVVAHVGVGPERQGPVRQQAIGVEGRGHRGDGEAAGGHHADGPRRALDRPCAHVAQPVDDADLRRRRVERDFDLLLDPAQLLGRHREHEPVVERPRLDRAVVGFVAADLVLGGVPDPVAAVVLPLAPAGLAGEVLAHEEEVRRRRRSRTR